MAALREARSLPPSPFASRNHARRRAPTPSRPRIRFSRLHWLVLILGAATLSLVAAKGHDPRTELDTLTFHEAMGLRQLELPLPAGPSDAAEAGIADETTSRQIMTVRPGDSVARLLARAGIPHETVHRLVTSSEHGRQLGRLHPGEQIRIQTDSRQQLISLVHEISPERSLRFERDGDGFHSESVEVPLERRIEHATGTIERSLMAAGGRAGLSDRVILDVAGIFAWDIDFALDLRRGDRFTVVHESFYRDGEHVRDGAIMAAEFVNQGRSHRALRYTDPQGRVEYFAPDGTSTRRAFLRAPVEYTRITSGFGPRKHPQLHRMRNHNGVDYAAPTGTPIRATGDGRIVRRGWQGGYGRTVVIQHGERYSTLYAHLARFRDGRGVGARVQQGDIVGYVGASGLATGPHVHYEFLIDRVHRDPQTVELPSGDPVAPEFKPHFDAMTQPLTAQLSTLGRAYAAAAPR